MSTLLWFILIAAFMFFMHNGRGAHGGGMGCCGGGHAHGSHNHHSHDHNATADRDPDYRSAAELSAMKEAEYELPDEQMENQNNRKTDIESMHHPESESEKHKV